MSLRMSSSVNTSSSGSLARAESIGWCLKDTHRRAELWGGQCHSHDYKNNHTPLKFVCSSGHNFCLTRGSLTQGRWCPHCNTFESYCERLCRGVLELLTGLQWPKRRPEWLRSPRGGRMELDGYCEPLGAAFEFHGEQHDRYVPHMHKGEKTLARRQADDRWKRGRCAEHDVLLLEFDWRTRPRDLPELIASSLRRLLGDGVRLPDDFSLDSFDLGIGAGPLADLHSIAADRFGSLLSQTYLGASVPLLWQCIGGHTWAAAPGSIRSGSWCPYCYGHRLWAPNMTESDARLAAAQAHARERNGICLGDSYLNNRADLKWQCVAGHVWEAPWTEVQSGNWCRICGWERAASRLRGSLEACQSAATGLGGKCLASTYTNNSTSLQFECALGHAFEARPGSVQQHHWCPYCSGHKLWRPGLTEGEARLEECREIAATRGGKCLSGKYEGAHGRLEWECAEGHRWTAKPNSLKNGTWCKTCGVEAAAAAKRGSVLACQSIAAARHGLFLSTTYDGAHTRHQWRCKKGHEWLATPASVKSRTWCGICAREENGDRCRGTLQGCQVAAGKHGGECLSSEYLGAKVKLQWRCKKGHEWWAEPSSVMADHWCRPCAIEATSASRRGTVAGCQKLAAVKKGRFLSETYLGAHVRHQWCCERGHKWLATPASVKSRHWCKRCAMRALAERRRRG